MKAQFLFILILFLTYSIGFSQNAITLDPNFTKTNSSKVLVEGVGSITQELKTYIHAGGYGSTLQKIGLFSQSTTPDNTYKNASIVGLSSHSAIENTGVIGIGQGTNNTLNYGGVFLGIGNTTNTNFGMYSSVHNAGFGTVFGGYFRVNGVFNRSMARFGIFIDNSAVVNDTTRANVRNGLYVNTTGKLFQNSTLFGVLSEIAPMQNDTITYNNISKAVVGNNYAKNSSINIGVEGYATNRGKGEAYAGFFSTNYSGIPTSNGSRTGIKVNVISTNQDTVTVNSRIGIYSAVNGHTNYDNVAIYAENDNFGDTLTAVSRYGIRASVGGKSKNENVAFKANSYSIGSSNAIGVNAVVSNNQQSGGILYGIKATAIQNSNSQNAYGGYFSAINNISTNMNTVYGIYTQSSSPYSSPSNTSTINGLYSAGYSYGNNATNGVYAYAFGNSTSTGNMKGLYSLGYAENISNSNPVYGIYTQAAGYSVGTKYGIYATASGTGTLYAGYFQGNVHVNGTLSKSGGTFKIDHPTDPENKFLSHGFVESPEMKNIYDGVITTNGTGDATVTLPNYFEALNITFRYQLTCIGQFAQAIIYEEIKGNSFKIKTDKPNVKVSWQVTGVRNDIWAKTNPIIVEENKSPAERGKYLNPVLYNKQMTDGIGYEPLDINTVKLNAQENLKEVQQIKEPKK